MYNMILSGVWQEGEKLLSENRLADQFNVSRVVIREALQMLRAQRYVITRQGSGSYISNPNNYTLAGDGSEDTMNISAEKFRELNEFRSCVENKAIMLAAKYGTEQDFDRIRSAALGMKTSADNLVAYTEADYQFHYSIVLASHNRFLIQACNGCKDLLFGTFLELNKLKGCRPFGYECHQRVATKIFERDPKGAISALQKMGDYNELRYAEFFTPEI